MNEGCPSAETLAAYAEGRMAREERSTVTEHLLGCEDCYEVVSEVGALREELEPEVASNEARPEERSVRAFPARGIGIALAVAAALAVVFLASPLRHRLPFTLGPDAELRTLAAAIEEERPIEPRVASFEWAPLRPVVRGGSGSSYELLAAAAKIEKSAGEDPSGESARRLGIARLLLGEWDASIELLARAAEENTSAATLSDLAAAKIARGVATGSRSDFLEAYEDAARAVAADPGHEGALFNRALALHRSGIDPDAAARAWNDYLAVDATSGWAEEARARLGELGAEPNASWSSSVDALLAHLERAQIDEARTIINRHPLEARLLFEERLLGEWGRALLEGDETAARRHLDSAARLAGELGARGDPAPTLAITSIETAPPSLLPSLARGHSLYSTGRAAYRSREYARADSEAREAMQLLEGSPHASLAALLRSSVAYVRRDLELSARLLFAAESTAFSSPSILGQIDWMRGLILIQEGRSFEALEPLERGAKRFAALGELENAAALRLMSAYALDELGERDRAWETRVSAAVDTMGSDA
ncbi:MAG: hypothetical protein LC732_02720, partial [Acidobacteria bacterium]|nr:hypothetical protein [Acidobacteriota bacterium]